MKKASELTTFWAIFENIGEYIKLFVIAEIVSFILLLFSADQANTLEEGGWVAITIFSFIISFLLCLGYWIYTRVNDGV